MTSSRTPAAPGISPSSSVPRQAEGEHADGGQHRAEREAAVAAEREQAHAAGLGGARGEVGVAGALRVEGGDADADRTIAANVSA